MQVEKLVNTTSDVVPLIAALPYVITVEPNNSEPPAIYDPEEQQTIYSMGRDYSTSREDDSAGGWLSTKSDTKKDD
jgi:hypothetical protein